MVEEYYYDDYMVRVMLPGRTDTLELLKEKGFQLSSIFVLVIESIIYPTFGNTNIVEGLLLSVDQLVLVRFVGSSGKSSTIMQR